MIELDLGVQSDPYSEMTQVLIDVENLSTEDVKKKLQFEFEYTRPNVNGVYRYNLFLIQGDSASILMKVIPSHDQGVGIEAYEEIIWSQRLADKENATLLRTGYLSIDDVEIKDFRAIGTVRDTITAMDDLLKAHFPNHEITVQDIDRADSGFGKS